MDISQKIGTFETSIEPFEDCCTIFVAKHPVTKPNLDLIKKSETKLEEKIDEMLKQPRLYGVEKTGVRILGLPLRKDYVEWDVLFSVKTGRICLNDIWC